MLYMATGTPQANVAGRKYVRGINVLPQTKKRLPEAPAINRIRRCNYEKLRDESKRYFGSFGRLQHEAISRPGLIDRVFCYPLGLFVLECPLVYVYNKDNKKNNRN